jgi:hypothetical protein
MSEDSTAIKNPVTCQADSITPKTLVIKDKSRGKKSVVICPAVLRRTEHWHQESVAHLKLTVIDSDGSTNSR